jgi:hypothetical protein
MTRNQLVEFQNEEEELSRTFVMQANPEVTTAKFLLFSKTKKLLGWHRAYCQPQVGSTVLLQIKTGSFGEPPAPSALDLTLELDQ